MHPNMHVLTYGTIFTPSSMTFTQNFHAAPHIIRELKECFRYFNLEYATLMKDVSTRWLRFYKAVERLLACWPAVKSYFVNLRNFEIEILKNSSQTNKFLENRQISIDV
jgi:hypothetical protein